MPGFLAHLPDSVSAKTFSHDLQGILDGSFKLYDYGAIKNLQLYGSLKAPDYDWSNYGVPTVIFHSDNDNLAVNQVIESYCITIICTDRNIRRKMRCNF
jgi:hypothetical protein